MSMDMGGDMAARAAESMDDVTLRQMAEADRAAARQDVAKERMMDKMQETINVFDSKLYKKKKSLTEQSKRLNQASDAKKAKKSGTSDQQMKDTAQKYEKKNPELKQKILMLLREHIKDGDDSDTILEKLKQFYEDVSLQDEALEFLEETTTGDLNDKVKEAKEKLEQQSGREIRAGRNIATQAREFATKGLGSPTALRDMYRDITGNPREPRALFNELSDRFRYAELKKVMDFLFHSLGQDLKSKGPSIPKAFLSRLMSQTRTLQAILGVYNFFRGRMRLMRKQFKQNGLTIPKQLNFENLAKEFIALTGERYPSPEKVLQRAPKLGIDNSVMAKIIVFSMVRDGIRQTALQVYRNLQHRNDTHTATIEALEDLEDELDEMDIEDDDGEDEFDWGSDNLQMQGKDEGPTENQREKTEEQEDQR